MTNDKWPYTRASLYSCCTYRLPLHLPPRTISSSPPCAYMYIVAARFQACLRDADGYLPMNSQDIPSANAPKPFLHSTCAALIVASYYRSNQFIFINLITCTTPESLRLVDRTWFIFFYFAYVKFVSFSDLVEQAIEFHAYLFNEKNVYII